MQRAAVGWTSRLLALHPLIDTAAVLICPDLLGVGVRGDDGAVVASHGAPYHVRRAVRSTVVGDKGVAVGVLELERVGDHLVENGVEVLEVVGAAGRRRVLVDEDPVRVGTTVVSDCVCRSAKVTFDIDSRKRGVLPLIDRLDVVNNSHAGAIRVI